MIRELRSESFNKSAEKDLNVVEGDHPQHIWEIGETAGDVEVECIDACSKKIEHDAKDSSEGNSHQSDHSFSVDDVVFVGSLGEFWGRLVKIRHNVDAAAASCEEYREIADEREDAFAIL